MSSDFPKAYTWNGRHVESLSHVELCAIVGELIERQSQDREELHRRRLDAIWVVPEAPRPTGGRMDE